MIFSLTLVFALLKLEHMAQRRNPDLTTNEEPVAGDQIYDTAADEFMMAFSAANYDTGEPVSDPRYVRWYATTTDVIDGTPAYNWYPMHQCSAEEFSRFYSPINQETELHMKERHDTAELYCFDFKAVDFDLRGSLNTGNDYTAVDL